jgi:GMP synthase-like glutamine amidotransferase
MSSWKVGADIGLDAEKTRPQYSRGPSRPRRATKPSALNRHAPFLILETGRPVPGMRRHGAFPHLIRTAAGLGRGQVDVVPVLDGHAPPPPTGYAGVLVTGSGAMVTDREPWSERTADWLREAAQRGLPMLGICYGHQLIAQALGGEVGWNPNGREMGTVPVRLADVARHDPLFGGLPSEFHAQTTHLQTVLASTAARPSDGVSVPGACSSIPSSAPPTCAATSMPAVTPWPAKANAMRACWPRCVRHRWRAPCCDASLPTRWARATAESSPSDPLRSTPP